MKLTKPVGRLQTQRLVYVKYLVLQGKRYLENTIVESYFNISVILFANASEILCQTLSYCIDGKDRSTDRISDVLKLLRKLPNFPFSELDKVVKARNAIYHGAAFHTYNTCADISEIVQRACIELYSNPLGLDYNSISLTDLIKDEKLRIPLRKAEQHLFENNLIDGVICICESFARLEHRIKVRGHQQVPSYPGLSFDAKISWQSIERVAGWSSNVTTVGARDIGARLGVFSSHIEEQVNKKISGLAQYFNFLLMLGSAYEDYKHFESLSPVYDIMLDESFICERKIVEAMNYEKEQVEFMMNFVLKAILDIEPKLKPVEIRSLSKKVIRTIP